MEGNRSKTEGEEVGKPQWNKEAVECILSSTGVEEDILSSAGVEDIPLNAEVEVGGSLPRWSWEWDKVEVSNLQAEDGAGIRFQRLQEEGKESRTSLEAEEGVGIQFRCLREEDTVLKMSLEEDMVSRSSSEGGTASRLMSTMWRKKCQLG